MPKIIKKEVDKAIPRNDGKPLFIFDSEIKGFGLRVTGTPESPVKSYIVQARVGSKKVRIKIGRHGALDADGQPMTPERARNKAKEMIGKMVSGENPAPEMMPTTVTLDQIWERYQKARQLRPTTNTIYSGALRRCFHDWRSMPIAEITKNMVEERHREISNNETSKRGKGEAHANQAMRVLRSLYNYAASVYEDEATGRSLLPENPTRRLSQAKLWNKNRRRQRLVPKAKLKSWYNAVMKSENEAVRDFLIVCLFTGLRRKEASTLTWKNIDLDTKVLTLYSGETKNHEEHQLPLSQFLVDLFKRRRDRSQSDFVFPGEKPNSPIHEVRRVIAAVKKESKVEFSTHDLRRTFLTTAEGLDLPMYVLKKLANHKMTQDVTHGYIVADVERLREPMNRITEYLSFECGIE